MSVISRKCAAFNRVLGCVVAMSMLLVLARPGFAQARPDEVLVGPITLAQEVAGVKVTAVVTSYFHLASKPDGLYLDARVESNLQDLQSKFASIVDTIPLPKDNCKSFKPDNLVVDLPTKALETKGTNAVIKIAGKIDVWTCLENPIPNSKVEWEMKKIGPIKTKVPVVKTWPGSPIKNKAASQPFEVTLPVALRQLGDNGVGLVLGDPNVELKGQYVFITKGLLNLAGVNVNEAARKALDKAISPNDLIAAIPDEYEAMQPVVTSASFGDKNGKLMAYVTLSAKIPAEKLNEFAQLLVTHLDKKK